MSAVRPPKSGLVDLAAVRRCDRAFDALAARRDAHFDDPAVQLLTALVVDVDADLPTPRAATGERGKEERDPPLVPVRLHPGNRHPDSRLDGRRSRGFDARGAGRLLGARAALAASVVVAALTSTGVAAANIGHFEPVGRVLGISENAAAPTAPKSAVIEVRGALTTAAGLMEEGRYVAARQALGLARQRMAHIRGTEGAVLAADITRLEARLARETGAKDAAAGGSRNRHPASSAPSAGAGASATAPQSPKPPAATGKNGNPGQSGKPGKVPGADKAGKVPDAANDTADDRSGNPAGGIDLQVGDHADGDQASDGDADRPDHPLGGPPGQTKDHPKGGPPGQAENHRGGNG